MIKIVLRNSQEVKWEKGEYTDYLYDGKFFIIIKDNQWVGMYNTEFIISVIVK